MNEDTDMQEEGRDDLPAYVPPRIITYTSEELLEQIGPAMACSPSPCPVTG
jgi:hypothetical protein